MLYDPPELSELEQAVLSRIADLRKRLRFATSTPRRWSGLLRRNMLAQAIRGSNSIEGYVASVEDVVAAVEGDAPFSETENETWQAVIGYRNALTYVLQLSKDPAFRYQEGFIRSLHFMMMQHDLGKNPGNWRPGAIYIRDEQQNQIVYEGPDRDLLEPLMDELIQSLNREHSQAEMVKAAMAHLNLVMIHPFSDGNGRMARCLQTLVLAREGILEPEFCSVEEHLGKVQQEYYQVLSKVGQGAWHPENDASPWIRFMLKAHHAQASLLQWRMDQLNRIWEELDLLLRQRGLPERMLQPVVDAALRMKLRNSSYRRTANISENLASRDLKVLVDMGFLVASGEKRGRWYEAAPMLLEFRERLREPFKPIDPFTQQQPKLPGM